MIYKDLNQNQLRAVTSNNKKILVMAGAGSGKTKVLTTRIMHQLKQGASTFDICAFTFTNKAASEMKWRLEAMIKKEGLEIEPPIISTFHSYCYSFISYQDFYFDLGFTKRPEVIMDSDKEKIIQNILSQYEEDYSDIPFVKNISRVKNGAKLEGIKEKDILMFNTVYHEYQEALLASNSLDFDDMIPMFIKLCKTNKMFKDLVQTKYLLIDECQDTNQIQYELINILSERYGNVFMVGDEDQLIYSFRSSDVAILKDFQLFADEVIILNQNYRCNQDILNHANKLIEYNPNRLKKELFSEIKTIKNVEYKEFTSTNDEAITVAYRIKELVDSGFKYSDIAILYRNNNQSYTIEKELNGLDIPYQLFGGKPFFEYKDVKSIIYTYRLLFNPKNEIAFMNIYNFNYKIEVYEYQIFMNDYKLQSLDLITYAANYKYNPKFQKLGLDLMQLKKDLEHLSNYDFFLKLLEVLHYNKYLKESNKQKPQYSRIMALKDMIQNLERNDLEDSFNQMILDNQKQNPNNKVSLLTIHKAKGLEFEVVFVIGFNEGILPGYQKQGKELEEERRLGYVAITRAKQQLYLYCSIIHFINGNMTKLKPSSFLVEAGINEANSMDFFRNHWYNH